MVSLVEDIDQICMCPSWTYDFEETSRDSLNTLSLLAIYNREYQTLVCVLPRKFANIFIGFMLSSIGFGAISIGFASRPIGFGDFYFGFTSRPIGFASSYIAYKSKLVGY